MRAVWYEETGPARDVLRAGEMDAPGPGPGEVLVRLFASGVNPSDYKRRAGWLGMKPPFPRIVPHSDGAGVIEAVGPGVPRTRVGERVWTWNAQGEERAFGTAAEYVALPSGQAPVLPDAADFATGACLGVPACTAHYAVFGHGPVDGATVLIAGGAGAVGHAAVQMAKWGGATVLATVSSEEKAERARGGGADHVIDYRREDVADRVMEWTEGVGVDRIIEVDFGANVEIDLRILRTNGTIAAYSSTSRPEPAFPYYPLAFKGATIWLVQAYRMPRGHRRRAVAEINGLLEERRLEMPVGAGYPLEETAAAHEAAEGGSVVGNVVVEIP